MTKKENLIYPKIDFNFKKELLTSAPLTFCPDKIPLHQSQWKSNEWFYM